VVVKKKVVPKRAKVVLRGPQVERRALSIGTGQRRVTIASLAPRLSVTCLLDDAPPKLSGYGGWQTVARPQRRSIVEWQGLDPWLLELAVILDGWASRTSVEHDCATLATLATPGGAFQPPPTVGVNLPALVLPDTAWVIQTLDWGTNVIRDEDAKGNVYRLRQDAALQLIQLVEASTLRRQRPTAGRKKANAGSAKCPAPGGSRGVAKLAAAHHTTSAAILKANKLRDAAKVKAHQVLRLP